MVKPKALFSPRPVLEYSRFAGLITAKRLLLFSSIASFVWKPAQFEFRSGAGHNASIAFVKEYTAIFFFISEIELVYSDKHRHCTETKGTSTVSLVKSETDHKNRLVTD